MREFKSWHSYSDFRATTLREYRYVWPPEVKDFLQTVLSTSNTRQRFIPAETILWRAQIGHGVQSYYQEEEYITDIPAPYPRDRMKPLRGQAAEGRANPKGIPYLYLANKQKTAVSEVRPWIGSLVSVAQFKILRELTLVNCYSTETKHLLYLEEPNPQGREEAVWIDIDKAFSEPVTLSDRTAGYGPTQILAELFKAEGFDGIAYRSAFGGGYNVVLFDIDVAELINCSLYEVNEINVNFVEVANPYFVRKHYDEKRDRTKST